MMPLAFLLAWMLCPPACCGLPAGCSPLPRGAAGISPARTSMKPGARLAGQSPVAHKNNDGSARI